jgi:acyl-CoA thioesterase-1
VTRGLGRPLRLALALALGSGLGLTGCSGEDPSPDLERGSATVFLGDSVSAGVDPATHQPSATASWVTYAVRDPDSPWSLAANASVFGETLADFRARFQADVLDRGPDAVVIMGGVNDTLRGTPVADSVAALEAMVRAARSAGLRVWVVSPTPIDSGIGRSSEALVTAERTVAERLGATYLDVYDEVVTPSTGDWQPGFSRDGVHPTVAGARRLATLIVRLAR